MAMQLGDAQALLGEIFAPWVQALGIEITAIEETGARFRMPGNADLSRGGGAGGGVVCGQAIGAAADTCSVVALAAVGGAFRPCTTVDLTTHFLRPLPEGAAEGGLMIEVEASDGHDNYWILTPDDIARGAGS